MRTLIGKNPLAMMTELVEHNLSLWKSVNEQLQKPYAPPVSISEIFPSTQSVAPSSNPQSTAPREKSDKERKGKKDQDAT